MSKNPVIEKQFVVEKVVSNLADEAGGEELVLAYTPPPAEKVQEPVSEEGKKQRALIQEAMSAYIAASAGLTPEVRNSTVTLLSASHARARVVAQELVDGDAELRREGKGGHRPTLSVFYQQSANTLRSMAGDSLGIPEETDRELLLLIADTRESIAWTMVKCFDKAEAAMGSARMRSTRLIEGRLRPSTVSKYLQ